MNRYFSGLLLTSVGIFAAANLGFGQSTYTYRAGWFPLDDAACRIAAVEIGARFTTATGNQVLAAGCERPFSWKQDVVIQYYADAEAKLVSTFAEFATADQGFYATKEDCDADLPNEVRLFERETGLDAVTYYCYPETKQTSENKFPYIARVDGFGAPETKPFVFTGTIYDPPAMTALDAETLFRDSLSNLRSLEETRVKVDFTGSLPRVAVKYYSTRRRPLVLETVVGFESLQACNAAQLDTDHFINGFGVDGLRSFCARKKFSQSATHTYFGLVTGAYKVEKVPGSYPSRNECEAALPGIESRYATATGSSRVEGVCTFERQEIFSNETFFAKVFIQI